MNTHTISRYVALSCIALLSPTLANAHHSFQAFDMQQTITIEGVVTDFDLTNPHIYLTMDVINEQGGIESWEIESVAANLFRRNGADENTFVAGERISVEANPPRNTARRMANGEVFTKSDGSQIFARGAPGQRSAPAAPSFADSIEGTWMGPAGPLGLGLVNKGAVTSWPLTEKGSKLLDAYDGSQTDSVNCVAYSAPSLMVIPAPISIEMSDSLVTFRIPNETAVRHIYIDGRPHPETMETSIQGHSIGHWDDDGALVIDTTHFSEHKLGNALGLPSGLGKHLTERLALSEDRSKLDYSFTLEDPEYLTDQVTRSFQWSYSPDADLDIEPCDPETAARFLKAY